MERLKAPGKRKVSSLEWRKTSRDERKPSSSRNRLKKFKDENVTFQYHPKRKVAYTYDMGLKELPTYQDWLSEQQERDP